jgi:1-acyl-sn-glycerol-3-phosphate acyltransferase
MDGQAHHLSRAPRTVLRGLGGIAVDRRTPHAVVQRAIALMQEEPRVFVALAPEGTRKPVTRWKTGFYHIAMAGPVPIVPVALDYSSRAVDIGRPLWPSGDYEADVTLLRSHFAAHMARHPDRYR